MSPLYKGPNSVRKNMAELTQGKVGATRQKAIATIAKKNNISREEARFKQALAIAKSQARKK